MVERHAAAPRYLRSHYRCVTMSLGGAIAVLTIFHQQVGQTECVVGKTEKRAPNKRHNPAGRVAIYVVFPSAEPKH